MLLHAMYLWCPVLNFSSNLYWIVLYLLLPLLLFFETLFDIPECESIPREWELLGCMRHEYERFLRSSHQIQRVWLSRFFACRFDLLCSSACARVTNTGLSYNLFCVGRDVKQEQTRVWPSCLWGFRTCLPFCSGGRAVLYDLLSLSTW